jgi:hypothetical protein
MPLVSCNQHGAPYACYVQAGGAHVSAGLCQCDGLPSRHCPVEIHATAARLFLSIWLRKRHNTLEAILERAAERVEARQHGHLPTEG